MKYSHRADRVYFSARQRCNNKNCKAYKNYGGRGIKCLMTKEDFRMLWDRDKADKLEKPSIDRINVDGDYTVKNCRFIELRENAGVRRKNINKFCPSGHPYTGSNLHIKMYHGKKTRSCRACAVKHRKKHMEKVVGESLRKKDEVIARLKEILKGRDEPLSSTPIQTMLSRGSTKHLVAAMSKPSITTQPNKPYPRLGRRGSERLR